MHTCICTQPNLRVIATGEGVARVGELVLGRVALGKPGGLRMSATHGHARHHRHAQANLPADAGGTGGVFKHRAGGFVHLGAEATATLNFDAPVDHGRRQLLLLIEQRVFTPSAVSVIPSGHVGPHVHHEGSGGLHPHDIEALSYQIVPGYERQILAFGAGGRFTAEGKRNRQQQQKNWSHLCSRERLREKTALWYKRLHIGLS